MRKRQGKQWDHWSSWKLKLRVSSLASKLRLWKLPWAGADFKLSRYRPTKATFRQGKSWNLRLLWHEVPINQLWKISPSEPKFAEVLIAVKNCLLRSTCFHQLRTLIHHQSQNAPASPTNCENVNNTCNYDNTATRPSKTVLWRRWPTAMPRARETPSKSTRSQSIGVEL